MPYPFAYEPGKLGNALGLTFQQVQKYERGSSRLYVLTAFWRCPYPFSNDIPQEIAAGQPRFAEAAQASIDQDDLAKRETLELVRAYYKVKDALVRKRSFDLVKAIGGQTIEEIS